LPLPRAEPGLVVRYDYLWSRRAQHAADSADKARPACLLFAVVAQDGMTEVLILPITHAPPTADDIGVEIPRRVKQALGLDDAPSWIIVTDGNRDVWPSPDLQQVPGAAGRFHYGILPRPLFRQVRDAFAAAFRSRRVSLIDRDGDPNV